MGGFSFSVLFGVSQIFMETNKNCFCNREKSTDYYLKAKKTQKNKTNKKKTSPKRLCLLVPCTSAKFLRPVSFNDNSSMRRPYVTNLWRFRWTAVLDQGPSQVREGTPGNETPY
jgi:hypothetical protein